MSDVLLIFPPLVETNFGNYFPSTAILAGYLEGSGIQTRQVDLNEEFAIHLLTPSILAATGAQTEGRLLGIPLNAQPAAAARLLSRIGGQLFDRHGRHRFRIDEPGAAHLLAIYASALRMDGTVETLLDPAIESTPLGAIFREFFGTWLDRLSSLPKLIGISVPMGPQLGPTLILARMLKRHAPATRIVMGGPALSLLQIADLETILLRSEIDAIVRFEGEIPFLQIARDTLSGNWQPWAAPQTSFRTATGIVHTPTTRGLRLDDLPFARYERDVFEKLANPEIGIIQARGCYWGKCAYCDFVELYEGSPRYRTRSPARFASEMEHQLETVGDFNFAVITESIPATFGLKLAAELKQRNLSVRWNSFAMVERRFDRSTFATLASAGCTHLVIGLETLNDRVLALVDKAGRREVSLAFLTAARDAGIALRINLIPNLPSTTEAEAYETLDLLRSYRDCLESVSVFPFEATRSSRIGRELESFALRPVAITGEGQAQFSANHICFDDPAMPNDRLQKVILAYRLFANEVNGLHTELTNGTRYEELWLRDHEILALNWDHCDIRKTSDAVFIYNWMSRRHVTLSRNWLSLINSLESGPQPCAATPIKRMSLEQRETVRAAINQYHFIIPAGAS